MKISAIRNGSTLSSILGEESKIIHSNVGHPTMILCVPWEWTEEREHKDEKTGKKTTATHNCFDLVPVSRVLQGIESTSGTLARRFKDAPINDLQDASQSLWNKIIEYVNDNAIMSANWNALETSINAKLEEKKRPLIDIDCEHPSLAVLDADLAILRTTIEEKDAKRIASWKQDTAAFKAGKLDQISKKRAVEIESWNTEQDKRNARVSKRAELEAQHKIIQDQIDAL